ncbi:Hypothetical predicted protein, partial [Scomber scombrus]
RQLTVNSDRVLNHLTHWKEARIIQHAKGVRATRDITFTSLFLNQAEQGKQARKQQ